MPRGCPAYDLLQFAQFVPFSGHEAPGVPQEGVGEVGTCTAPRPAPLLPSTPTDGWVAVFLTARARLRYDARPLFPSIPLEPLRCGPSAGPLAKGARFSVQQLGGGGACANGAAPLSRLSRNADSVSGRFASGERLLADMFNAVEHTGKWPISLRRSLITLIPKGEGADPLQLRPISVMSPIYRLWAAARLRDMLGWQERWIARGQKGFRPGFSCDDVYYDISLRVEEALLSGTPMGAVSWDYRKCFDLVPQEILLRLCMAAWRQSWRQHWLWRQSLAAWRHGGMAA
eukprot:gene19581-biopygen10780